MGCNQEYDIYIIYTADRLHSLYSSTSQYLHNNAVPVPTNDVV